MSALVRSVVFDGLTLDHPAVSMLLGVLAPIAETVPGPRLRVAGPLMGGVSALADGVKGPLPSLDGGKVPFTPQAS